MAEPFGHKKGAGRQETTLEAPRKLVVVPFGQGRQAWSGSSAAWYVPRPQATQLVAFGAGATLPGGQSVQVAEPKLAANLPALQGEQDRGLSPLLSARAYPAAQGEQNVDDSAAA